MRLNHNLYSLGIYKTYTRSVKSHANAMDNLSSGSKLKNAKDNPDKIAQAETLRMTVIGRSAASSNIQDTNSMLQTFDGALQEMNNNVSRLKQLTVLGATGTLTDDDKAIVQKEIDSIKKSMDELVKNTDFNGIGLSDGTLGNLVDGAVSDPSKDIKTTIGTLGGETMSIPRFNLSLESLGLDDIDVTTDASGALSKVDRAGVFLSNVRGRYGAIANRLENTDISLNEISETLTSAQSDLADADVALEIMEVTKNKILIDSAIGLMAQSNKLPQDALNILAGVR